jgi:uncharacterized protein
MIDHDGDGEPRLVGGSCARCERFHFPSAPTCPWCGTDGTAHSLLSATGELVGWTAVTSAPPGYAGPVPYGIGVVALPEGLEVVGRLTVSDPGALHQGQLLRTVVEVVPTNDEGVELTTWAFAPSER